MWYIVPPIVGITTTQDHGEAAAYASSELSADRTALPLSSIMSTDSELASVIPPSPVEEDTEDMDVYVISLILDWHLH